MNDDSAHLESLSVIDVFFVDLMPVSVDILPTNVKRHCRLASLVVSIAFTDEC